MNKRAFNIIFLTVFVDLLGAGLIIPILSVYAKQIGASDIQVGFIAAAFALTNFICSPYLGSLSDRVGRRPVILIAIAVDVVGYLIFSHAFTLPIFVLARVLNGFGSSNIGAALAYVADITTPEARTEYMGKLGAAFGLGFIFGPAFGGVIKAQFGFSAVGYFAAALCAINFVSVYYFLPESLKEKHANAKISLFPYTDFKKAIENPLLAGFFSIMFVSVFAFGLMQIVLPLLWKETYGQDDNHIGYLFTVIGIISALVQGVFVSKLLKRIGEQKMLRYGIILMTIGFAAIPFVPTAYFLLCTIGVLAFIATGNGILDPSITAMISKSAAANIQGKVLGLNESVISIAFVIAPICSGFLYQAHRAAPFIFAAIFMALSLLIATGVLKKYSASVTSTI